MLPSRHSNALLIVLVATAGLLAVAGSAGGSRLGAKNRLSQLMTSWSPARGTKRRQCPAAYRASDRLELSNG